MTINIHVNLAVSVGGVGSAQANFGQALVVGEHSVTGNRQDGPYSSLSSVVDAGFTVAATPEIHGWATRFFAQQPRSSSLMIGRRASAEHIVTALDAIEAVDPARFYAVASVSNVTAELVAMQLWVDSRAKIAIGQTSSAAALAGTASTAQTTTFTFGGTATDGTYSIAVRNAWTNALVGTASVVRSTTPATNSDLATAMRSAWDAVAALAAISAPAGGAGAAVAITFDGLGSLYTFTLTAPAPGTLVATDTPGTQNPAELMSDLSSDRMLLVYHDDDTEYLDAAILASCLRFNLDAPNGAGQWAYQPGPSGFKGITATRLSDAQKAQLILDKCNYYAPVRFTSGNEEPGVFWPGITTSGRDMDITTTVDITKARLEEALLGMFLQAAGSSSPKIPYTDKGLARPQSTALGVLENLGRAGHFDLGAISETTGRRTPWVDVPTAASVSAATKQSRKLTMQAEAILAGGIKSIGDSVTVGFTIDLNFV